jgi:hypothetical protein
MYIWNRTLAVYRSHKFCYDIYICRALYMKIKALSLLYLGSLWRNCRDTSHPGHHENVTRFVAIDK